MRDIACVPLLVFATLSLVSIAAAGQGLPPPAMAASAPVTLDRVVVSGQAERETAMTPVDGYRAKNATAASKTDTPLNETAQSVTIVTRDQIRDQGATNVQDALGYSAGVRGDAYGLDSRTDSVRIRGAYPDEYLDGLRKNYDYYTSNARTEVFTLERIEILRGPAAMLYGQGSTGGVVNMVSKRPQPEAQGEVGLQLGSYDRKQAQLDLTGPLSSDRQWLYRVIAVGRKADTQVDYVRDDRALLAPSLTWRPGAATSWTFQGLYQKDRTGSTSQFFPWAGTLTFNPNGRLPTNRFIGDPDWDRYDTERQSLGWLFEHRFNDSWTVRQNLRWTKTDNTYQSLYADSFTLPGGWAADPVGQRLIGRFAYGSLTHTTLWGADQHLLGKFETGAVKHELLLGLDAAWYSKRSQSALDNPPYYGGTVPLIDAYSPDYSGFVPPAYATDPSSKIRQKGLYLQDQLRFGGGFILSLGARHDRASSSTEGTDTSETSATTKRAGLLYAFPAGWSPYVSYSESFTPIANIGAQTFKPLRGKQWEAGLKFEPPGAGYAMNVAAYDLRESNQLEQDPITMLYTQLGETRARGVEFEARGSFTTALDLIANYTYTDLDEKLEAVPRHQAQAWARYKFALGGIGGFSAGAGVRYMSAFHDGAAPEVPSVTLLDLLAAWEQGPWRVALNVTNATDKVYLATCLSRGDCWWGGRRNVVASVAYRF